MIPLDLALVIIGAYALGYITKAIQDRANRD